MSEVHPKPWHMVIFAVLGVAGTVDSYVLLADAYQKVATGHGAETYQTVWLVDVSYIGLLVSAGAAAFAVLVAVIFGAVHRAREQRDRRQLNGK